MTFAPLSLDAELTPRSTRDRLFGDRPLRVVAALAVVGLVVSQVAAGAGVVLAFSGWMGSEPAPAYVPAVFVAGVALSAAVAVAYWRAGRALVPAVLMALASAALLVPWWGALVGSPCAVLAVVALFVGPVARMRHKRVVGLCVVVTAAVVVLVSWLVSTSADASHARRDTAQAVRVALDARAAGEVTVSGMYGSGDELATTARTSVLAGGHVPLLLVATDRSVCAVSRDPVRGRYHGHDEGGPRSGRTRVEVCPLASAAEAFSIDYPVSVHVVYDGSAKPVITGGREPFTFRVTSAVPGASVELPQGVRFDATTGVFVEEDWWLGHEDVYVPVVVEVTDADGLTVSADIGLT
ncbi:hypothetical protein [Cellulomonas sp. URHB0016]